MDNELIPQSDSEFQGGNNSLQKPASQLSEINDIIKSSDDLVKSISASISTVCSTMTDIKKMSAQVEIETARMNRLVDSLMIKANRDVEIYKSSIPMLNEQFNNIQNRLDMLMSRALDMVSSDFSDDAMRRSEFAMQLIDKTHTALSQLIAKLIPQY